MLKSKGGTKFDPLDPQKAALYNWEDEWWGWNFSILSLAECRNIVRAACKAYRLAPPKVTQHLKRSYSWSDGETVSFQAAGTINKHTHGLETGGKNLHVALHESAHYITDHLYGINVETHGPEFLSTYLQLMARWRVAPQDALEYSLRARGLKWRKN